MRSSLIILIGCLLFSLHAGGFNYYSMYLITPPDTIPPPPNGSPNQLSGPSSSCVGDTSAYYIDVPVACSCQWYVNGSVQPGSSSPFIITWSLSGMHEVSVVFLCSNGQISDPVTITVLVSETPQPMPISGDNPVCEYTYHTYSTTAGPYDSCEWKVNGVIQPGYSPEISYTFGETGVYEFEVIVYNSCGVSQPQTLDVTAQGNAPAPPSPIQGPAESCTGNTSTYTTSVGPGESCEWRIDGALQPSTTTTLEVAWSEWGERLIEVRAVSDCGTGNPALKSVAVFYEPYVFLGNDSTILQGQTLILDAGNPGSEYLWSTGATTQTLPVSLTGTYDVIVSNYCGVDSDTIDVTVFVGINESISNVECSRLTADHRRIFFMDMPAGVNQIQVSNLAGMVCYEGPPLSEIQVGRTGIYFVRVISPTTVCNKKVFVP